jgi:hypothetical protein
MQILAEDMKQKLTKGELAWNHWMPVNVNNYKEIKGNGWRRFPLTTSVWGWMWNKRTFPFHRQTYVTPPIYSIDWITNWVLRQSTHHYILKTRTERELGVVYRIYTTRQIHYMHYSTDSPESHRFWDHNKILRISKWACTYSEFSFSAWSITLTLLTPNDHAACFGIPVGIQYKHGCKLYNA